MSRRPGSATVRLRNTLSRPSRNSGTSGSAMSMFCEWMASSPFRSSSFRTRGTISPAHPRSFRPQGVLSVVALHPRLVGIRRRGIVQRAVFLRIARRRFHRIGVGLRILDRRGAGLGGLRLRRRHWLLGHMRQRSRRPLCSGKGRAAARGHGSCASKCSAPNFASSIRGFQGPGDDRADREALNSLSRDFRPSGRSTVVAVSDAREGTGSASGPTS